MQDMIKMVVVVTLLCSVSGGLLAAVESSTKDRIENQQLTFVKGPAIKSILDGASNDPIADRFKLPLGDMEKSFFVGVYDSEPTTVVLESFGKGYGGNVGVMVGIDTKNNQLLGAGVTTHAETPGMGAKAKTDPSFVAQFKGMPLQETYVVGSGDGQVNAISGATITSRAVCSATNDALKIYEKIKPQLADKLKEFK